ncbi:hypothetical protein KEM55_004163 [Ascosphaera atra]|nr:hypothetical protein KEM55_004163 [Ascosphaera atra]
MHLLDLVFVLGAVTSSVDALLPIRFSQAALERTGIGAHYGQQAHGKRKPAVKAGIVKTVKRSSLTSNVVMADDTKTKGSVPLNDDGYDNSYFVEAEVGQQRKKVKLLLDSGAPNTWVMGDTCNTDACKSHDSLKEGKPMGSKFEVAYGTGKAKGDYVNETFAVGDLNLTLPFGVATYASDAFANFPSDGILGIGFSRKELTPPSFMQSVIKANAMEQNIIGLNLFRSSEEKKDGEVVFGGIDKSRISGVIAYNDVDKNASRWQIPLTGASIDNNTLELNDMSALIDTGTSYVLAPKKNADQLHSFIKGAQSIQNGYTIPCDTKAEFTLSFPNANFTVSPKDYVGNPIPKLNNVCSSNIVPNGAFGNETWLLGDVFIRNVYVVFDFDKTRVGLARRNTNDNSSSFATSSSASASATTASTSTAAATNTASAATAAATNTASATAGAQNAARSSQSKDSMAAGIRTPSYTALSLFFIAVVFLSL